MIHPASSEYHANKTIRTTCFRGLDVQHVSRAGKSCKANEWLRMYKVVRRSSARASSRISIEETDKFGLAISFLVIGVSKVHFIPVPIKVKSSSSKSLKDSLGAADTNTSHGIMALTWIDVTASSDDFSLAFRKPMQKAEMFQMSSLAGPDLALELRKRDSALRPLWPNPTYSFNVPFDDYTLPEVEIDDAERFWQSLTAFCAAYAIDYGRIIYEIRDDPDGWYEFVLYPPQIGKPYSALELLAILRSLRYNEQFGSMSFSGVSFDPLNGLYDPYGNEYVSQRTRNGGPIGLPAAQQVEATLLISELRSLATSTRRLRRINMAGCITHDPALMTTGSAQPESSGIFEAFDAICRTQSTNVDWFCVDNIVLSDMDLGYLVNIAADRKCHLRGFEASGCGLTNRSLNLVLDALKSQSETLEVLSLSRNVARFEPFFLSRQLDSLSFIRRLDLSHMGVNTSAEPLLGFDTLKKWRLEHLVLDGIPLNSQSLCDLCGYVDAFLSLKSLHAKRLLIVLQVPRASSVRGSKVFESK